MTTEQLGSFYLVDAQFFSPAVLPNYRSTLPDTERSCKVVEVKVLRLISKIRSYDCQVVGVAETVKLSSKSLVHKDAPGSRQDQPNNRNTSHRVFESAGDAEESASDEDEVAEVEAVDPAVDEVFLVGAKDWRSVPDFEDPLTSEHPHFDVDCCGRLRSRIAMTPCDVIFAFSSLELVEPAFPAWRTHAAENGRNGLEKLDARIFLRFLSLVLKMAVTLLRRRALYFTDAVVHHHDAAPVRKSALHDQGRRISAVQGGRSTTRWTSSYFQ
jgi:hypothetical protein